MTRLSDPELADLARRRDLSGDDVQRAVATALATSAGDPAYHHLVTPGPVADYRGLWGLDVVARPGFADMDLHHPEEAADAMADLVHSTGGFGWCAAYRSGRSAHYLDRAAPAASMLPGRHRDDEPMAGGPLRAMGSDLRAQIATELGALRQRSRNQRTP